MSILESGRHKLLIAHGLTLITPSLREYEPFIRFGALIHTMITWALSPTASLRGLPYIHGVAGTPHEEVHNIDRERYFVWLSMMMVVAL